MKDKNQGLAVGVDIGGTNIKLGLVTNQGQVIDHLSFPLIRKDRIADISSIGLLIEKFIKKQNAADQIVGIGVASPGILDSASGVVHYAVNLGWENVRLTEILQNELQLPVQLEGDAVAGALGEKCYGAGVEMDSFLYVCIGTGVGASLLQDNTFYRGDLGSAINIGHTSVIHEGIPCECGNLGCLEKYVSASAITNRVKSELQHVNTVLNQNTHEQKEITPLQIYEAAKSGDSYSLKVFREAGDLLGVALVNCLHLFGVGNIIVGGGLSQAGDYLLGSTRGTIAERLPEQGELKVKVVNAAFPTLSGVLGAAAKILMTHEKAMSERRRT